MGGDDVMRALRPVVMVLGALLAAACAADVGGTAQDIVGGTEASDGFAVALVARRVSCDETITTQCSGVLIGPRTVLTSAHCVTGFSVPSELEVFFGPDVTGPGTFVLVQTGAVDPAYDRATGAHDLAILALSADAPVTPAVLATTSVETLAAGTPLRVLGYGTTDPGMPRVGVRRQATMTLGEVRATAFDAAPGPGLSCRGDSGGPVLATIGGTEQVVGITASGDVACVARATQARIDVATTDFIQPTLAMFATLGPAWPTTAIPLDQVATHACTDATECPALMICDTSTSRCALPNVGPASFGSACTTDAACGMDLCARLWPDGADACRCAHASIAPPTTMGPMGGCSVGWGRGSALLALLFLFAAVASGRGRGFAIAGAAVVAMIAIAIALRPRPQLPAHPPSTVAEHVDAPPPVSDAPPPTEHVGPVAPPPSSAATAPPDLTGLTIAEQAALIGDDDLSDGLDLPPPALQDGPGPELPTQPEADPTRVLEQREAGLHLLDTTIERLGHEADQLADEGDSEGAARARIRAERMTTLRARRAEELETLRAGGTLPSVGPIIPGHEPPTTQ